MLCRASRTPATIANIWCAWQLIQSGTYFWRYGRGRLQGRFSDHCGNNMRRVFVLWCACRLNASVDLVPLTQLCRSVQYSVCVCLRVRSSLISSSFKSCHRADTIVRRAFHRQISDVPVIQSNYTERNRYCYTPGIDSKQNRKVKIRPHTHL